MYKIYAILGAEYPRPDCHRASEAKPLVGGQRVKPLKAESNFIFGRPVEAATLWLWGRAPCAPCGSTDDKKLGYILENLCYIYARLEEKTVVLLVFYLHVEYMV